MLSKYFLNKLFVLKKILFIGLPFAIVSGPLLSDLFISLIGIFFLIYCFFEKKNFYLFKNIFFILLFFFNLYLIIISLFSKDLYLSLSSSLFYFRFLIFAFAIRFILIKDANMAIYFFYSLCLMSFILIIDSYYQYFNGANILGFEYNGVRLSSLFGEESILGSYLSRLMPIIFGLFAFKKIKSKYFLTLTLLILVLSDVIIFLSGERVAFFMLTLSSILIVLCVRNWFYVRLISILFSFVIILIILFIDLSVRDRMITTTIDQTNILGEKVVAFTPAHDALYKTALNIFYENYIFGIGPKMFREVCSDVIYYEIDGCSSHPHNSYIQLLAETGLIGFLILSSLFVYCLILIIRQLYAKFFNRESFVSDYYICFIIAIFVNFWPLMPTGNFFNNWMSVMYYLPIGFALYFKYDDEKKI